MVLPLGRRTPAVRACNAANLELLARLGPAWQTGARLRDDIVRRYNQNPFLLRDEHFGRTAKADILKPHRFNELLCKRIELMA
jgi:hypothetical protein